MKIDVIIPVYKPGKELLGLLERLQAQTVPVQKIILMNTEEKYFEQLVYGHRFSEKYPKVEVHHLSKREFDHGGTRRRGVKYSDGEIFIFLTQDAMPVDEYLVEKLTANLSGKVAVAYGRQLAGKQSNELEKLSREFNYPPVSRIKSLEDLPELGIKTFFCSDVCAAYRRDIYEELGGFVKHTIFNEDMIYASGAVRAGYQISYEAEAKVLHAHNYTNRQQLHRNFDLGVSQVEHPEVFGNVKSESEGKKLLQAAWQHFKGKKQLYCFPGFLLQCCFKYAGYLLGKHYRLLPKRAVLALTDNREYWRQNKD